VITWILQKLFCNANRHQCELDRKKISKNVADRILSLKNVIRIAGTIWFFDFDNDFSLFLDCFVEFRTNRTAEFLLAQSNLRQNKRSFRQKSSSRLKKLHFLVIPMKFFNDKNLSATSFEIFVWSILNRCLLASQSSCSIHAITL